MTIENVLQQIEKNWESELFDSITLEERSDQYFDNVARFGSRYLLVNRGAKR